MQKEQVLESVAQAASEKIVSKDEVVAAYDRGVGIVGQAEASQRKTFNITRILYYIGGAIVAMGIIFLVFQNWMDFSALTRIVITLGSSVAAYIVGAALIRDERFNVVAQAFFFISFLLLPLGLAVTLYEMDIEIGRAFPQAMISLGAFLAALGSLALFKKNVFIVFCVGFATWFLYSFVATVLTINSSNIDIFAYLTMAVGLAYIFLGYSFANTSRSALTGALYGFGLLAFYGATLSRGDFWDVLFPGFVFLGLIMSVFLKSRAFLTFSSIFLMIYLIKITAEYFSRSLGWSVSLVIAGLLLIMVAYVAVRFNKKYLTHETVRS